MNDAGDRLTLAEPTIAPDGTKVFDLRRPGRTDFVSGRSRHGGSTVTISARPCATRGEQVLVNVHNGVPESTTVHWHGMHLPPAMDGGPHQQVAAGGQWCAGMAGGPAGHHALVPPAPARRDGRARVPGAGGNVHCRRSGTAALALPEHLRGRRHPARSCRTRSSTAASEIDERPLFGDWACSATRSSSTAPTPRTWT